MTAFAANSNVLELRGLKDSITGTFINNASVSLSDLQQDDTGETVMPLSGSPITLEYIASSDGNYRAVLDAELPLVAGKCYVAHIDADGGTDRVGHWEFKFKVLRRTSQ